MNKATFVFNKIAKEKKRDFLTEEVKDTLAGGAAAVASTVGTFPLDSRATAAQAKSQDIDVRLSDLFKKKSPGQRELFKGQEGLSRVKNVGKKLIQKNFGGLGPKLLKTVPAAALTFGTFGATKRLLDEIDKEANFKKQLMDYSEDVYNTVAKEIKNNFDVDDVDKFMNKNVGRIKVRKGGKEMTIEDRRIRNAFKAFNPGRKRLFMTLDADTGKAKITRRDKNIYTSLSKPGKEVAENESKGKTLRNVLLGGGALATAGGAGYVSGSDSKKKEKPNYVRRKIRSL